MLRQALCALAIVSVGLAQASAQAGPPDLSGVWIISKRSDKGYSDQSGHPLDQAPYTALALERRARAEPGQDPASQCLTMFPRIMGWPYPIQVVQTARSTVILFEADTTFRQIYTDGRKLDPEDDPVWMGHSVGRWEGDVLVVDTQGVNETAWLDAEGSPISDVQHVTERFRLFDGGRSLEDLMTITDPKVFTRPVVKRFVYNLKPGWSLKEYVCEEGNRDDVSRPRPGAPGSLSPGPASPGSAAKEGP
jgi:hypothetical protein